jgi:hypothetical protein
MGKGVVLWCWGQLIPETGLCIYTKEQLEKPYKALKTAH